MTSLLLRDIAVSRSLLVDEATKTRSRLHVVDWRLELYDRPSYTCFYTESMCYHTKSIKNERAPKLECFKRAYWLKAGTSRHLSEKQVLRPFACYRMK